MLQKHVSEPWFSLIGLGEKTVEGRLNKGDFAKIRLGDRIFWVNDDFGYRRAVETEVIKIKRYPNFNQFLTKETLTRCLPAYGIPTIDHGVNIYRRFFTKEDETHYGVVAITISI